MTKENPVDIAEKIETLLRIRSNLHSDEKEEELRNRRDVEKYANLYHELTGAWYVPTRWKRSEDD